MTLNTAQQLIPFSLKNVDGSTVSTEDFNSARALAVIFWCNHCPYVRAWEDRIIQLQREYAGRGVQFLLVNSNDPQKYPSDSFEEMQVRARDKGYASPYLWPPGNVQGQPAGTPKTWAQVAREGTFAYPTQSRPMFKALQDPG